MWRGLLHAVQYRQLTVNLKKGDKLLLYTDGFFDSIDNNEHEPTFKEHIMAMLLADAKLPINTIADKLMALFDKKTQHKPKDDATFILIDTNDAI